MLPTFSPEGSGTRAGVACQLLVLRFPPKGWKQRGRRGACALRGEKPRAIASHGTGSGRPDDVAIPQPFSPPPPASRGAVRQVWSRSPPLARHIQPRGSCGGMRARPQRAPLTARADRVVPVHFPWRNSPARRRISGFAQRGDTLSCPLASAGEGGHPIECPRMLRLLFPHPYRRRRRCGKTRRGGRLDHAIDLDESATRDIMRMQRRFGKTEHRGKADVGVFH